MQTDRWQAIERVFHDALSRDPRERSDYLDHACGTDRELREEVEAMLASASDGAALHIEARFDSIRTESDSPADRSGTTIGNYTLARLLGRGGMGEVYVADRTDGAFQHQVAVKLLSGAMIGPEALHRFKAERQILARLNHPNIARLVDGGTTEDGRPYLVMHVIDGRPITRYCDEEILGLTERLELFRVVCDAVQYAHQNLIVHRDLKPSNILVSAAGEVKLLDFGIAKLLADDGETATTVTRSDVRMMTPESAAPEQIRGETITTSTDVYALGVLLFRLLTGKGPYVLNESSRHAVETAILSAEPVRPSQAVEDTALRRELSGDLDKIVLMALRKEPDRRYPSVNALSEDVRRFLSHLPVRAEHDTFSYRARKFVRRNRVAVSAFAVIMLLITGFGVVTALQAAALARQRDAARIERDRAEQVVQVLVDLFETNDPTIDPAADTLRVSQFLEQSAERIIADLSEQPELQTSMRHVLGTVHAARKDFTKARPLLDEALLQYRALHPNPDSIGARILLDLGIVASQLDGPGAEPLLREVLDVQRQVHGEEHEAVAHAMTLLGPVLAEPDERMSMLQRALEIRRTVLPARHPDIANGINTIAVQHYLAGDFRAAADRWSEALTMLEETYPEEHPDVMTVVGNLASAHTSLGNLDSAEVLNAETVARRRRVYGDHAAPVAIALNNMAVVRVLRFDYAGAEQAFREILSIWEVLYGREQGQSLNTAQYANTARNLAITLQYQGRYAESLEWFDNAIDAQIGFAGADAEQTLRMRVHRANALLDMGRQPAALDTLQLLVPMLGSFARDEGSQFVAEAETWLGRALLAVGRLDEARARFQTGADYRATVMGSESGLAAESLAGVGLVGAARGQWQEAESVLRRAYDNYRVYGNHVPAYLAEIRTALVRTYEALGRPNDAAAVAAADRP